MVENVLLSIGFDFSKVHAHQRVKYGTRTVD